MGDFNSAKVDVGLSLPFDGNGYDAAYEEARGWADRMIRDEVNRLKNKR